MSGQFDCPECNAGNKRCLKCITFAQQELLRSSKENPCTFRGICNLGRALKVSVGDPGGKPCEGPRKTFRSGAGDYTVCREHEGEFRYWCRGATEVP